MNRHQMQAHLTLMGWTPIRYSSEVQDVMTGVTDGDKCLLIYNDGTYMWYRGHRATPCSWKSLNAVDIGMCMFVLAPP